MAGEVRAVREWKETLCPQCGTTLRWWSAPTKRAERALAELIRLHDEAMHPETAQPAVGA